MAIEMKSWNWKWWCTSNRNRGVDIVCIHGLDGHREGTWTAKEPETGHPVFWIRDFLPPDLPRARIMAYGYSSQVPGVKYLTQRTLYSQSKALFTALKCSRQDVSANSRPIIFIAHSFGGLVVKSALIHADRDDHVFNDVRVCTGGVVFFGTPHQGTPDTSWAEIVSALVRPKIDLNRMRDTLNSDLGWLQCQLEQYKSLDEFFPTYCVYEEEKFLINLGASTTIPRVAAIPRELLNTTTLLTASRRQGHMNLCKFQSRDPEYRETVQQIRIMYERSRDLVSKNILLDQLRRMADNDGDTFCIPMNLSQNRVNSFLGRDTELRTLHDYLGNQRLVTLLGPHEIGKTQIALEYAYAYQSNYSSVFWVDAQNWFTLRSSFLKIAEQLKNQYVGTSEGEEQLKALHYLYLGGLIDEEGRAQSCHDSAELLSLVYRDTDLREFQMGEFLDSPINGHVIITSQSLRRGQTLDVHELELNDAATLLRRTTRLGETPILLAGDILELVNKLGRIPLAIKQAGAFLSSSQWSVHRYSQILSPNPPSISRIATLSSHLSLPNVWTASIQQIDKETVELLNTIALLSENDIPIEFIKSTFQEFPGSEVDSVVEKRLTTLKEYSLIRYDSATPTVALDSCMSEWLRESMKEKPDNYRLRARMACSSVSSYLKSAMAGVSSITYTTKQYRVEEQLLPYIERCVNYVQILSRDEADWGTWGDICRRQGRHDLAKRCHEIIPRDYQQLPLRAKMLLRDMHDIEYQEEGEHAKAEIIWRRVNSTRSKTFGDFHPLTLKTAARLAMTLQQQGKYSQAKAIYSLTRNAIATVGERLAGPLSS
ncbi:hypothetical protein GGR58DRAFT_497457 [Xylaria digitata]|nr:hypothetical protein GGR58DRAFT_497457 [Xylaria digitata]